MTRHLWVSDLLGHTFLVLLSWRGGVTRCWRPCSLDTVKWKKITHSFKLRCKLTPSLAILPSNKKLLPFEAYVERIGWLAKCLQHEGINKSLGGSWMASETCTSAFKSWWRFLLTVNCKWLTVTRSWHLKGHAIHYFYRLFILFFLSGKIWGVNGASKPVAQELETSFYPSVPKSDHRVRDRPKITNSLHWLLYNVKPCSEYKWSL